MNLFFVSHTHWDREWYEPFQVFRLRLVCAIDKLLDILARDPEYRYFMLDGQTIVLSDYAEVRPERMGELAAHIAEGRVLVGPWYVLPDQFLVSGEAILRNLLRGLRTAASYGEAGVMRVGYIPDPFGHISQMPQILRGFEMEAAVFRRGLADEPVELEWEGADGTRILTVYLRESYDNAAWLRRQPDEFAAGLAKLRDELAPYLRTPDVLLMNGTDHMEPWPEVSRLLAYARTVLPDDIAHSTLPKYIAQVQKDLGNRPLPCVTGERRNPKRHHLLPGVTSSRMWIKQRNAYAQNLLEKWAEPLVAAAGLVSPEDGSVATRMQDALRLAWEYLLQNQPHDSICGCSVDQVHREMGVRFDAVEQIVDSVLPEAQRVLLSQVDTRHSRAGVAVVVFNPNEGPIAEMVESVVEVPGSLEHFALVDDADRQVEYVELERQVEEYMNMEVDAEGFNMYRGMVEAGPVLGMYLAELEMGTEGRLAHVDATLSKNEVINPELKPAMERLLEEAARNEGTTFQVRVHSPVKIRYAFPARVPGYGYRTLFLRPGTGAGHSPSDPAGARGGLPETFELENESLAVKPDLLTGMLHVTDKVTGAVFAQTNRFVDEGDRGDLYNWAPVHDLVIEHPVTADERNERVTDQPQFEWVERNALRQSLRIRLHYHVPASLSEDRNLRSREIVDLAITTTVTLARGVRRLDFQTEVENSARDHRLRVHFPSSIKTAQSFAEQAFDVVERSVSLPLPAETMDWIEQPVGTLPMQSYSAIRDEHAGLLLSTRGLPEYEALPGSGDNGVTIALTLLRCVDSLSRNDLETRRGHAGPEKHTPGAQEQGRHIFEYAIVPFAGTSSPQSEEAWLEAVRLAHAFAVPPRAVPTTVHEGPLPAVGPIVAVDPDGFLLTAIKAPETGHGLVVRGYNLNSRSVQVRMRTFQAFKRAALVDLSEKERAPLDLQEGRQMTFAVRPREIVTVRFE